MLKRFVLLCGLFALPGLVLAAGGVKVEVTNTSLAVTGTVTTTGGLTDTELRASSVPVTGPLTDAELRASSVPVTGPLTDTQLRASSVPVTGPLTDTELRASSVPVTGPLTDAEIRASALPISGTVSTVEVSISTSGTPTTVSVSTSAWTMVPASSSLASREGIMLSLPTALNAVVVGHFGDCTSTAVATTVRPLEFAKGGFVFVPLSNDVCLWTLSLHTAAESIHVQEIGQ